MEPARGDHNDPAVAGARRGDRDSSRIEPVRGWWRNNQDFVVRHQERASRAAAAEAEGGDLDSSRTEPVRWWCRNNQDLVVRHQERIRRAAGAAATEAEGGDRDSSRTEPVRGWWRINQDFILRHRERIRRAAAAAAAAEAEGAARSSEPASKKAMVALRVPAVGEVPEQDCAVCLEDFTAGGRKLRTMPCSHSFHQRCIFVWLLVDRRCPMCRFAMPSRANDEEDDDVDVERELLAEAVERDAHGKDIVDSVRSGAPLV